MTAPAVTDLMPIFTIVIGFGLLIGIAGYIWYASALSRLFPRIDGEGWKGWVPILNEAEILARGGVPAWSVVFYFIPLVQIYGLYLKVVATHRINKRFGRSAGMTVLAILLPPVWATVLALGAPPYPEGDRLAALQPHTRRSAPTGTAVARDASGYTIPSLAPHSMTPADAAPFAPVAGGSAPQPPAPITEVPFAPAAPIAEVPIAHAQAAEPVVAAPDEGSARAVRAVPPVFHNDNARDAGRQAPMIRPAPGASVEVPPAAPPIAPVPRPAYPLEVPPSGLPADADATIVAPRAADDDLEATVVVARKRGVRRVLVLDDGRRFSLSGASVVIGRNPNGEAGEQRLAISDTTRTLSKTHARLVVRDDEWSLTDLNATNGVVVFAADGAEVLIDPGESVVGSGRFILGEVGMQVVAESDS